MWPTSSMIRHDGFTSPEITESSLPYFLALTNFAFSSEAFRKYVLKLRQQQDLPYAWARCVFPTPGGPINAMFFLAYISVKAERFLTLSESFPCIRPKSKQSKVFGTLSGSRLVLRRKSIAAWRFFSSR